MFETHVGEDHSTHRSVLRPSHGIFFVSSSNAMFSTKTLDFFISPSQLVDVRE